MAERVGFEPTIPLRVCRISSAVLSTTQPPLQDAKAWFAEAGFLSCASPPRKAHEPMARDALVRLEIVLLLALTAGPIDGEDANPKQQCENVHERGSPAQIVLPGSFSVLTLATAPRGKT